MPAVSKKQQMAMADPTAAYIAGFFDGEGCITMRRSNRSSGRAPTYSLVVSFTNRDLPLLTWLQAKLGGKIYPKSRKSVEHSPAWELTIFRRAEVEQFIDVIGPWVRIKGRQVDLGRSFVHLGKTKKNYTARGKTWPLMSTDPVDLQIREEFKQALTIMNKRGSGCLQ